MAQNQNRAYAIIIIWTGQAQTLLELLNCSNKSVIYTLPSETLILRNEQATYYCMWETRAYECSIHGPYLQPMLWPQSIMGQIHGTHRAAGNFRVQRYYLQKYIQSEEETIDTFFTRCKLRALRCKFTQAELNERLIEQLNVGTIFTGLHKELLGKNEHLALEEAINIGRTHKASINHVAQLRGMQHNDVHAINTRKKSSCSYCGTQHGRKEKCPAHGSTCRNCGKKNHWQSVCRMSDNRDRPRQRETQRYDAKQRAAPRQRSQSRRRRSPSRQRHGYQKKDRTHTVTQSPALGETFEALSIDSVNNESSDTRDEIFAMINITLEDRPHIPATLKEKVDTGASGNIIPLRIFRRTYPTKLNAEGFPA